MTAALESVAVVFRCRHCRRTLRVPASLAGKAGLCPRCREPVRVPRPDARPNEARAARARAIDAHPRAKERPERRPALQDGVRCPHCRARLRSPARTCPACRAAVPAEHRGNSADVPLPLRVYGGIHLGLAALGLLLVAGAFFLAGRHAAAGGSIAAALVGFRLVGVFIELRLGLALWRGQRSGIVVACALAALSLLAALAFAADGELAVAALTLKGGLVLHAIPAAIGFKEWKRLA